MQDEQYFDNIFQMNRTISQEKYNNMEKELNEFITNVKSQNLSPIEQVMVVYDRAKMFESAKNDKLLEMQQLPDVLTSNKAGTVGYTSFFNECMTRLGYNNCAIESYIGDLYHMHSLVEINDDKYDIHGIYNFDPTCDSLDIDSTDRTISYAFFGRSVEEINHLREKRIPKGVSIALMKGMDGKYSEVSNEIPTRTMNIINGFFPSEENRRFLHEHFSELKDKSNWPALNEEHLFQISNLGFKVRRSENIPIDTLEKIICNARKIENPDLNEEQINLQMNEIKEFNNTQFSAYYSDPRLLFKIIPKNYVSEDNYSKVLEDINDLYSQRNSNKPLNTIVEFTNGQQQQVFLKIESLSNEEKKILMDYTFDSNYAFNHKFLNPLIHSYVESFPYSSSEIEKPQYFNLKIRNYVSKSISGSSLSVIDGDLDYLRQIDSYIKSNSQKVETSIKKGSEEKLDNQTNESFFSTPNTDSVENVMDGNNREQLSIQQEDNKISILKNDALDEEQVQSQTMNISNQNRHTSKDDANTRINQYNEYRAQVLPFLLSTDSNVYVHSDFTIVGENGEICRHTLEKMTDDSRQIISQRDFECDEMFRSGMLEPSLLDYAKTNPIVNGKVNDSNNGLSQYMAFSETNNVLTVNNISKEYASHIDEEIKKVNPIAFRQQMEQYQQQVENSNGYQRVLKRENGFLNIFMLSSIVGFMAGLIAFVMYIIIKMKGMG